MKNGPLGAVCIWPVGRCRRQPRSLRGASELSLLDGLFIDGELVVSVLGLVLEGVELVSVEGVVAVLVGGRGWVPGLSVVCAKAMPPTTTKQAAAMPVRR